MQAGKQNYPELLKEPYNLRNKPHENFSKIKAAKRKIIAKIIKIVIAVDIQTTILLIQSLLKSLLIRRVLRLWY